MLTWKSLLAASGAVLAVYIALFVYLLYRDFPPTGEERAFGVELLADQAKGMLLWPPFWLTAVAVFIVVAFLVKKWQG